MIGATSMDANILMPIQLIDGGAFFLIVTLITSALFYVLGRLIGRIALLEAGVAHLEARL